MNIESTIPRPIESETNKMHQEICHKLAAFSKDGHQPISLFVPADFSFIPDIRKGVMENFKLDPEKAGDYQTILGEFINNAFEHGANLGDPLKKHRDPNKRIHLKLEKKDHELWIEIQNPLNSQNRFFDYKKIIEKADKYSAEYSDRQAEPQIDLDNFDLSKIAEGGMGLNIISVIADGIKGENPTIYFKDYEDKPDMTDTVILRFELIK